jgi:hypothetical protein
MMVYLCYEIKMTKLMNKGYSAKIRTFDFREINIGHGFD